MINLCIAKINKESITETFILNHIKYLPNVSEVIYGSSELFYNAKTGLKLINETYLRRFLLWFERKFQRKTYKSQLVSAQVKFLKARGITHVLAEYGSTAIHLSEACQFLKIHLVVHFHGVDAYQDNEIISSEYKRILPSLKAIVVVSRHMKSHMAKVLGPLENIHYIPYGVDLQVFSPILDRANTSDKIKIISVGRFTMKKAQHLLILAFHKVLNEIPNAELILVGKSGIEGAKSTLFTMCEQIVIGLGIESNVHFKGNLSHQEVGLALSKCDIYIQSSISILGDSEGTPNALLEAGAYGLACIGSNHGGIPDVIEDGISGFIVDEFDVNQLAQRMIQLAKDHSQRNLFGRNLRSKIEQEFDLQVQLDKLHELIVS